ncbi:uncharacterized protein BDR25DRAFT_2571 [Lindgomyces ingoldianus]|uniref:Uncharacterized protein n=1 Tax=Lindgomyces ingoldianus TaxID=673940 RepID=A0ACB6RFS8_9PLEO|nr:uncharacterized protein BDR25DRAFT_2571 [Lindgomyces ingoldianus]KAF2477623.1 hypothetical protein BDR25DRAFT_2571 [Lindgomyces ingoldianus]
MADLATGGPLEEGESITIPPKTRKRTKTGCLTCRKRRIRCGEERPVCCNCIRAKRQCEGYNQRVTFKSPTGNWSKMPGVVSWLPYHSPHTLSQSWNTLPFIQKLPLTSDFSNGEFGSTLDSDFPSAFSAPNPTEPAYVHSQHLSPSEPEFPQDWGQVEQQPLAPNFNQTIIDEGCFEGSQPSTNNSRPFFVGDGTAFEYLDDDYFDLESDEDSAICLTEDDTSPYKFAFVETLNRFNRHERNAIYYDGTLDLYRPQHTANPIKDANVAQLFSFFVNVTGPSLASFGMDYGNNFWTVTLPTMGLNNLGLLHAILALSSLQLANLHRSSKTPSYKHYAYSLKRIHRAVGNPKTRVLPGTLATSLLLALYELMTGDHTKWKAHLMGTHLILLEINFKGMSEAYSTGQLSTGHRLPNYDLLYSLTGLRQYQDRMRQNLSHPAYKDFTNTDLDLFEIYLNLFWSYVKQDIYHSIFKCEDLILDYERWSDWPPRTASHASSSNALSSALDHLYLILARTVQFAAKDHRRKQAVAKSNGREWILLAPPTPSSLKEVLTKEDQPSGLRADTKDAEISRRLEYGKAYVEWAQIERALEIFKGSLGHEFEPSLPSCAPNARATTAESPFGDLIFYETPGIAHLQALIHMTQIMILRNHPDTPLGELDALSSCKSRTMQDALKIGRILAGTGLPAIQAASIGNVMPLLIAGLVYDNKEQRTWTVRSLKSVAECTGWDFAGQALVAVQDLWNQKAEAGRGPEWHRNAHSDTGLTTDCNTATPRPCDNIGVVQERVPEIIAHRVPGTLIKEVVHAGLQHSWGHSPQDFRQKAVFDLRSISTREHGVKAEDVSDSDSGIKDVQFEWTNEKIEDEGVKPRPNPTTVGPITNLHIRRERPCDACRRRKSLCVIQDGSVLCVLCEFHKEECTSSLLPRKQNIAGFESSDPTPAEIEIGKLEDTLISMENSGESIGINLPSRVHQVNSPKDERSPHSDTMLSDQSSIESEFSASTETADELSSLQMERCRVVDRVMVYFHSIFRAMPTVTCRGNESRSSRTTNDASSGSNACAPGSSHPSNTTLGKRARIDEDENLSEPDGNPSKRPKNPSGRISAEPNNNRRKFACPYFKRNFEKYLERRSCVGPGWDEVRRVKEHLYRNHTLPIFCPRCYATFKVQALLHEHQRADERCPKRHEVAIEGFDKLQEKRLRSRKRVQPEVSEEDKWREMYRILFPDDDDMLMPSPYMECDWEKIYQRSKPISNELERYEHFLRRELPPAVRRELEIAVEKEFSPLEERLKCQLIEIVRDLQLRLFQSYTQSRDAPVGTHEEKAVPNSSDTELAPEVEASGLLPETSMQPPSVDSADTLENQLAPFEPVPPWKDALAFDPILFQFHGEDFEDSAYGSLFDTFAESGCANEACDDASGFYSNPVNENGEGPSNRGG